MPKYTRYLFWFSLLTSLTSLVLMEKGGKEIYPFYSWKLFTVPSGGEPTADQYRIYGIKGSDTIRIPLVDTNIGYTRLESTSPMLFYGNKIDKKEDVQTSIEKLKTFSVAAYPQYTRFAIYKETYTTQNIGTQDFRMTKKLIAAY